MQMSFFVADSSVRDITKPHFLQQKVAALLATGTLIHGVDEPYDGNERVPLVAEDPLPKVWIVGVRGTLLPISDCLSDTGEGVQGCELISVREPHCGWKM